MSGKTEDCCLEQIKGFPVSEEGACPGAEDICCTQTNDIIVVGSKGMAIFDDKGSLKKGINMKSPFKATRVSMNTQGIVMMDNIKLPNPGYCQKCKMRPEVDLIRCDAFSAGLGNSSCILSTCPCTGNKDISITKPELEKRKVSAIMPTDDFHILVYNSLNSTVYDFLAGKLINKIHLGTTLQHTQASLETLQSCDRSSNGDIIVAYYIHKCIEVFDSAGKFKRKFGPEISKGIYPIGICVDDQDRIIVADRDNHRVLLLNLEGQLLSTLVPNTIQEDVDLRPAAVATARGRLVVLLHGLPRTYTRIVCIYSGLDKVGHNKTEKADNAPPPYSEMKGCSLKGKSK